MSRFRSASVAAAVLVVGVVAVAGSGVLGDRASSAVNDLGQLLGGAAATLSKARQAAASALADAVRERLAALAMDGADFTAALAPRSPMRSSSSRTTNGRPRCLR